MLKKTMFVTLAVVLSNSGFAVEKKVRIEAPIQYEKNKKGRTVIKSSSYRERRPKWGIRLNFSTSMIELLDELKGEKDSVPFQLDLGINRNFKMFSVGPEVGFLSAKFKNTAKVTGFSVGGAVYLDGLFENVYVVPFASGGVISLSGDINQLAQDGTVKNLDIDFKSMVPYYRAGVLIGLNWLDKSSSRSAMADYGLQNSYLYAAMRKILETKVNEGGFNLETKLYAEFGLQIEF